MNNINIQSLIEALSQSPDNIPLRLLLADTYYNNGQLQKAEDEYLIILKKSDNLNARLGLANVYFQKENYSTCNVILEALLQEHENHLAAWILYSKALLKEGDMGRAMEAYKRALEIEPNIQDESLDAALRVGYTILPEEEEENYDDRFVVKPDIDFSAVAGMESVKKEIDLKIIKPFLHPELYQAYGKKAGGGILLYGPPGCGKTYIAKATAGQINAKFISIELNDILDMWVGNSEKNLHEIFELARQNTPCVLFIDEVDALGASRNDMKQSNTRSIINQFLQELDGLKSDNEGVLVIAATNTPWNMDPAFRRPGRFDRILFVPPPDIQTRAAILEIKLRNKPANSIDYSAIAQKTEHYSGADLDAVIDIAIESKMEKAFETGMVQPMETKDLLAAIKKHKPSTQEWFGIAKNYALFANESGLYDDILQYIKKGK